MIIFEILMETKLNNDISQLVILTKNVKSLVLTHKIPICSISTTINCDLQRCYNGNKELFFFNWDSPHARLNSHYKAWSYKGLARWHARYATRASTHDRPLLELLSQTSYWFRHTERKYFCYFLTDFILTFVNLFLKKISGPLNLWISGYLRNQFVIKRGVCNISVPFS